MFHLNIRRPAFPSRSPFSYTGLWRTESARAFFAVLPFLPLVAIAKMAVLLRAFVASETDKTTVTSDDPLVTGRKCG